MTWRHWNNSLKSGCVLQTSVGVDDWPAAWQRVHWAPGRTACKSRATVSKRRLAHSHVTQGNVKPEFSQNLTDFGLQCVEDKEPQIVMCFWTLEVLICPRKQTILLEGSFSVISQFGINKVLSNPIKYSVYWPQVLVLPHTLILALGGFQDFVNIGAIRSDVLLNILKQKSSHSGTVTKKIYMKSKLDCGFWRCCVFVDQNGSRCVPIFLTVLGTVGTHGQRSFYCSIK